MQQVEQGLKNVCTQDLTQVVSNVPSKPCLRCRMYQGINQRYIGTTDIQVNTHENIKRLCLSFSLPMRDKSINANAVML